jgi:hypothetical protein
MYKSVLLSTVLAFHGCDTTPNLQPWVSVTGHYSLLCHEPPQPKTGCVEGCKCNGTGKEKSGDGISVVNCRCPDTCACKAKSAVCKDGKCTSR